MEEFEELWEALYLRSAMLGLSLCFFYKFKSMKSRGTQNGFFSVNCCRVVHFLVFFLIKCIVVLSVLSPMSYKAYDRSRFLKAIILVWLCIGIVMLNPYCFEYLSSFIEPCSRYCRSEKGCTTTHTSLGVQLLCQRCSMMVRLSMKMVLRLQKLR